MLPGDRMVCALLEPLEPGDRFEAWPLHVTVIPWFRFEDSSERVAKGLWRAYTHVRPFSAKVGSEISLGPNKDRTARVLEPASFPELERLTRTYFHKKRAWLVDETTKARRDYLPHITYQGDDGPRQGDVVHCGRLYIIEQYGEYKEVVAKIPLT